MRGRLAECKGTARLRGHVVAVAICLAVGALPALASAGPARYTYEVCDSALPAGGTPSVKYAVSPGVPFTAFNTCAQPGGSIGITETGHAAATYAFWSIDVPGPPGGYVESMTVSGQACGLGPGNDHVFVYEQGWPGSCAESQKIFHIANAPSSFGGSGTGLWIFMNCDGNYAPGCEAGPSVSAHYIAATEVDPIAPTLGDSGGSLLSGGVARGHQTLFTQATDEGGGLSKIEVLVDGQPAGQPDSPACNLVKTKNASYLGTVAVSATPCPESGKADWTLDTALPPFHDGTNTVQVCASDFSTLGDPNTTCSASTPIAVDNSCTESLVLGGQELSVQFVRSHDEEVTVPYKQAAEVSGELTNDAGDPISGATICVQAHVQGSQRQLHPVGAAATDAHGHFTYKIAPGPSRKLLFGYRHDSFQVARSLRFYSHAEPTLGLSPSTVAAGGRIRIFGKLPGPRAAGRVVVLQASALRSSRWLTFRRATTNSHGAFHASYRFGATTSTITYRIRAVVPRQRGYPWEAGHSKPARVKVHR